MPDVVSSFGKLLRGLRRLIGTTVCLAALALAAICGTPAHAQKFDPSRTLIVFGGFGYLNSNEKSWLNDLVRQGANRKSTYDSEGRTLEDDVRAAARTSLSGGLGRWTSHGVVFGPADLARAYTSLMGDAAGVPPEDQLAAFDRAYLLVLTGGFEYDANYRTELAGQTRNHLYNWVSVSANLIDMAGGAEIVLSTTALGKMETTGMTPQEARAITEKPAAVAARYASAYRVGSDLAIQELAKLAVRISPEKLVSGWDTYTVTGAFIPDIATTTDAADLFDWRTKGPTGTYCRPANNCEQGSRACAALRGLLTSATSAALSRSGYKVMPPLSWSAAGRATDDIARYTLSLPHSTLPELASSANFIFNPEHATWKVLTLLGQATVHSEITRSPAVSRDVYTSAVVVQAVQTEPGQCKTVTRQVALGEPAAGAFENFRPTSAPTTDADARRLLNLIAIKNSLADLSAIKWK